MKTAYRAFVILALSAASCKGRTDADVAGDSNSQGKFYRATASADLSTAFGTSQGACLGSKGSDVIITPTVGALTSLDKYADVSFKVTQIIPQSTLGEKFKNLQNSACDLFDGVQTFKLTPGEWQLVEYGAPKPTSAPTAVATTSAETPQQSNNNPTPNTPVTQPATNTSTAASSDLSPGQKQIVVEIASDIGSTVLKNADNSQRCTITNIKGKQLLVAVNNTEDLVQAIQNKLLPVTIGAQNFNEMVDPKNSFCAKHVGYIYLPHFKCVKFGSGFSDPGNINSKFHSGLECSL